MDWISCKHGFGDQGVDWRQALLQRQQKQSEPLTCPRCGSTNTKFCYYNNYNKSQPRHFCKACKRHWTKGGILRNVPVGGSRKNKRLKPSNTTTKITESTVNAHLGVQRQVPALGQHDSINSANLTVSLPPPQNLHFPFSSLGPLDTNPSSSSSCFQSQNICSYFGSVTAINDLMPSLGSLVAQPCQVSNYWNWDDIAALGSTDDLKIPWNDADIKP